MKPLKIVFEMMTPICLSYPFIFFDGLLAHLVYRRELGEDFYALPSKRVIKVQGERLIPLKKTAGIYHASVSFFDFKDGFGYRIYKKFCERYFEYEKSRIKKIDRRRGAFRDHIIHLIYVPARKVTFYANGDREKIEDLLSSLSALGKKTSIGFGFFKKYVIEEIDEDRSIVYQGRAMRTIPFPLFSYATDIATMAYKPPYWAIENHIPCAIPGSFCKLNENFRKDFKLGMVLEKWRKSGGDIFWNGQTQKNSEEKREMP